MAGESGRASRARPPISVRLPREWMPRSDLRRRASVPGTRHALPVIRNPKLRCHSDPISCIIRLRDHHLPRRSPFLSPRPARTPAGRSSRSTRIVAIAPLYPARSARCHRDERRSRRVRAGGRSGPRREEVLREIRERGPLSPAQLTDHGSVVPLDWGGWKGTAKAHSMAIEALWTRCDIVVCGREGNTKLYDVPERALKKVVGRARIARKRASPDSRATAEFHRWALVERVEAAGLLSRAGGSTWSMLSDARAARVPEQLIDEGLLEEVVIEGSSRPYLAPAGFRRRTFPPSDGRMRILGPLDPLLWDRPLVKHVFGFEYVWEVYKPASQRRWGWYVCPLLHGDRFVGRLEGTVDRVLRSKKLWKEKGVKLDDDAADAALARHAASCGVKRVVRPRTR